ncbi:MAG: PaaI family thioesterase [Sulfurovum sp.]|nr:PaaI family thioesterase [Sulfurovum sp.]
MELNTHLNINTSLCGKVTKLEEDYAEVLLHTTQQMRADSQGLVHGGFIFGAADYAAMSAVNDPLVVLGASSSKFIAPVKVGDAVLCKARVVSKNGKKREVDVDAFVDKKHVFEGKLTTFVLPRHVLGG